jgi:hypothetical protein
VGSLNRFVAARSPEKYNGADFIAQPNCSAFRSVKCLLEFLVSDFSFDTLRRANVNQMMARRSLRAVPNIRSTFQHFQQRPGFDWREET